MRKSLEAILIIPPIQMSSLPIIISISFNCLQLLIPFCNEIQLGWSDSLVFHF